MFEKMCESPRNEFALIWKCLSDLYDWYECWIKEWMKYVLCHRWRCTCWIWTFYRRGNHWHIVYGAPWAPSVWNHWYQGWHESLHLRFQLRVKRPGCECHKAFGSTTKNRDSVLLNIIDKITYQLEMLQAFGNGKRVLLPESPVPNWLGTTFNVFGCRPWQHFIIVVIDEHRLNRFGPTRNDLVTKDALLRV